ncbi:translation initiation factor 2 [Paenibacillus endoradicis]|uniref:translation initiation factor 2 n=1 Tax=Paenibacillus endoradicis TaxID=2972487 RepID=UPI002159AAD7|nr:translation initiation factor 2 [Paenibacillus endoradicis]MCR8658871.1 translation initiation factor 2 [Paenibacillus endoradicis]
MDKKKTNNREQDNDEAETLIAKLGFWGVALATIGDGLATIAAGLELQQLEKAKEQRSDSQLDLDQQIELMQKQIDQLTYKIEKMERKKR